jgi:hypothetical protein
MEMFGKDGSTMATRIVTELHDDIDGSDATQTVRFALDGVEYEIDLSDRNAKATVSKNSSAMPARSMEGAATRRQHLLGPTRARLAL